jgi:CheY-like chemotaxis protein
MNGLLLQRRLAEGSKPVPIIFLSACSLPDEERQALQAGAAIWTARLWDTAPVLVFAILVSRWSDA